MLSWLPENVSTYGGEIDSLFYVIYYITLIVFLIKYQHREGRRATYTHGSNTLEVIWTIVPAVILVILAFMRQDVWGKIKMRIPAGDVQIQVTSKQFNWDMRLSRTG